MSSPQQAFERALQFHRAGRLGEAEAFYRQVLAQQPNHAGALHYLGLIAYQTGRYARAAELMGEAVEHDPNDATVCCNLGEAYRALGRLDEAMASYRHALALAPDLAGAHNNLGIALTEQGDFEAAAESHRRAIELQPNYPEAYLNLGTALVRQNRLDEAVVAFQRALELRPHYPAAYNNLGNAYKGRAELEEAIIAYRHALGLQPGHPSAHSNLIYALQFHPGADEDEIEKEKRRWNCQFGDSLKRFAASHENEPDAGRRLRIGYVSLEFRDNVIGRYLWPLFAFHDRQKFEIVCYSGVAKPDGLTEKFRERADRWKSTVGVGDEALAKMIREDGIDILVDLAQHTAGNRLTVFARQPAPVQVSFASYPASTGLEAIGYRISDRYLESEIGDGRSKIAPDLRSSERVLLVDSYWCHDPCGIDVETNALPALKGGGVTFGCLNNFCKINPPLLRLWGRLIGGLEGARLLVLTGEGSHRSRTVEILQEAGVEADRVAFAEPRPRQAYLELYRQVDIALDPFPYDGHSTSLDALWMGVPVVGLTGKPSVSRGGWSQLSNLRLPELVAFSEDDYVRIALGLARDLPRLAGLRASLRSRMQASALMNATGFAGQIEAAYRTMWRQWCARVR